VPAVGAEGQAPARPRVRVEGEQLPAGAGSHTFTLSSRSALASRPSGLKQRL
jgi:hypothetical protein